ncbi:aldehyde dehydrogenase [Agrobacterium sp. MOPV5]|uniref:aldehyde dehydrogenase n=1 Tax=Agrobacterium leguminum TaxID=2792015 RepID=UPI0018C3054A|nr:aldehyde dehydrogenase [Agrobacterium leguminum]MBG0511023.1 aldehyde dehydrogenase [Agrobacterium leguminum]
MDQNQKADVTHYDMFIGGKWVQSASAERFESTNPYDRKVWATFPRGNGEDAARAVAAAKEAFHSHEWAKMSATKRGHLLRRFADLIAKKAEHLAKIETTDNGKLINEMLAQVKYVPEWFYYFAGFADKLEGKVIPIDKADTFNFTRREPLGVCVAITAWNSPLLLAAYKLAPGLAAGNTFVLKPSEFTSASAIELAKIAEEAGLPAGVLNVVTGFGAEIGQPLVDHPDVAKVAFTGSEFGGQKVYESAARGLKRVTLELGGKSPNIVFNDADLDNAVKGAISGIFAASGQTCVAGSRLLVQKSIYDEFIERVVNFARTARMGNPLDTHTQVGPVTTEPQYKKILEYIDIAKSEGATTLLGGGPASRPECGNGQFVEPTIFGDVNNNMRIAREEVFGPVLSCIPFHDEEEAISIANDSPYALASGVWTNNLRRALVMSERLEAGTVWVNMYRAVSYMSPFGGHKRSGVGHENGLDAIYDYTKTKSVWMSTSTETPDPFVIR